MFSKILAPALVFAMTVAEQTQQVSDAQQSVEDATQEALDELADTYDEAQNWFAENTWALGLVYLAVGLVVALFGLQLFPWVAAIVAALFVGSVCFWIPESAGWTASNGGFWTFFIIAILLGIAAGVFIRNKIWIAVAGLGGVGGWFGGVFLFAIIVDLFSYSEEWLWWVCAIVGAAAGFFAALKLGAPAVNICTSFIGAYLFTMALSMFFWSEHWPSSDEIMNGTLDTEAMGW